MVVRVYFFTFAAVVTISAAAPRSYGIGGFQLPFASDWAPRQAETVVEGHEPVSASTLCSDDAAAIACGDGDGFFCLEHVCDGIDDCLDGSDEQSCESMAVARCAGDDPVSCADDVGVVCKEQLCNGEEDCLDGSDEMSCGPATEPRCVGESSFVCSDGRGDVCLEQMCDGAEDCSDGSDEQGCEGRHTTPVSAPNPEAPTPTPTSEALTPTPTSEAPTPKPFHTPKSPTSTPAPEASTLDPTPTPEAPPSTSHKACVGDTSFLCTGGRKVCSEQVCDGYHDCEDGSDEQNCSRTSSANTSYPSPPTSSSPLPASDVNIALSRFHASDSHTPQKPSYASSALKPSYASSAQKPSYASGAQKPSYASSVPTESSSSPASGTPTLSTLPVSDDTTIHLSQSIASDASTTAGPSISVASTVPSLPSASMASDVSTTPISSIFVASTVPKSQSALGTFSSPDSFTAADSSISISSSTPTSLDAQVESFDELSSYDSNLEISLASGKSITSSSPSTLVIPTSSTPTAMEDLINLRHSITSDAMTTSSNFISGASTMSSLPSSSGVITSTRSLTVSEASILLSPSPSLGVQADSIPQLASDDSNHETLEIASDTMPSTSTAFTFNMPSSRSVSVILIQQSHSPASDTPIPQTQSIASKVSITENVSSRSENFPLLNTPSSADEHTKTSAYIFSYDKTTPTLPPASSVSTLKTFPNEAVTSTSPGLFPLSAVGDTTLLKSSSVTSFTRAVVTKSVPPHLTNSTSDSGSNGFSTPSSTSPASVTADSSTPIPNFATGNGNSIIRNPGFDASTTPIGTKANDTFTFSNFPSLSGLAELSTVLTTTGAPTSSIPASISSSLTHASLHTVSGAPNLSALPDTDRATSFSPNPSLETSTTRITYSAFNPFTAPSSLPLSGLPAPSSVFNSKGAPTSSIQSSVSDGSTSSSWFSVSEGHYASNSHPSTGFHTVSNFPPVSETPTRSDLLSQFGISTLAIPPSHVLGDTTTPRPFDTLLSYTPASLFSTLDSSTQPVLPSDVDDLTSSSPLTASNIHTASSSISISVLPIHSDSLSVSVFPIVKKSFLSAVSNTTKNLLISDAHSSPSSTVVSTFSSPSPDSDTSTFANLGHELDQFTSQSSHHVSVASSGPSLPLLSKAYTLAYPSLSSIVSSQSSFPSAPGDPAITSTSAQSFSPIMPSNSSVSVSPTMPSISSVLFSTLWSDIPVSIRFALPNPSHTSEVPTSTRQSIVSTTTTTTLSPDTNLPAAPLAFTPSNSPTPPDVPALQKSFFASDAHTLPNPQLASGNRNVPIQSAARNIPPWSRRSPARRKHGRN